MNLFHENILHQFLEFFTLTDRSIIQAIQEGILLKAHSGFGDHIREQGHWIIAL